MVGHHGASMKVVVAGGSGYIGRQLAASLLQEGHEVVVASRARAAAAPGRGPRIVSWDAKTASGPWVGELGGAQAVINLAGTNLGSGRWTRRRMAEILSSRLNATSAIVQALGRTPEKDRPRVLVNASGIDYYGNRADETLTEDARPGTSFLARVCEQWEAAAQKAERLGVRVVYMRTSLVVGGGAPSLRLMALPFRLFVGGPLGDGRQWFTWIHEADIVGLYRLTITDEALRGPVNAVAPDVRRQREVAREIGRVLRRPSWFKTPAVMLRLVLGEQASLLLDGRRAIPAKAESHGYAFRFGALPLALAEALGRRDPGR
jgi:uncharacterized protein